MCDHEESSEKPLLEAKGNWDIFIAKQSVALKNIEPHSTGNTVGFAPSYTGPQIGLQPSTCSKNFERAFIFFGPLFLKLKPNNRFLECCGQEDY